MKKRLKDLYSNFKTILMLPEMQILPGQLAFFFLMSFVPIIAFCILIGSYITQSYSLTTEIANLLPNAINNIILPLLDVSISSTNVFLFIACYVLISSNGVRSIIITANEVYMIKNQKYMHIFLKSIVMTIIVILLFLFILFIPILGDVIIKFIFKLMGSPTNIYNYIGLYEFLKLLATFFFIYFSIKLLYTMAPNMKIKSKSTTLGALFTTFGWIISTEIFAFYITKIAKFNVLYGNFANILILLLWIYLLAYLFVMGMAINVNRYKSSKEVKNE